MSSNKSFSAETANRYALALYELASENSELEAVKKNIKDLLEVYKSNVDLENFIKNPTQSQSNQLKVVGELSKKMSLSKITNSFLSILVSKRRIFFLKTLFQSFLSLVAKKKGELKASLVSSKNLSPEELNNLNKEISQVVGTSVSFDYKVDESLIGGLQMQLGSLMVDTSIKNKLKKYQQIMLEV